MKSSKVHAGRGPTVVAWRECFYRELVGDVGKSIIKEEGDGCVAFGQRGDAFGLLLPLLSNHDVCTTPGDFLIWRSDILKLSGDAKKGHQVVAI
ncbi:hypothetical protein [Rubritalea sp.]|uniref:hypothetical protein n=1 Tax=Rubritalea sp. TaxID=2109375 RepID=UPI003EF75A48